MEAPRLVAAPLMADKSGPTGLVELANAPLKEEGKGAFYEVLFYETSETCSSLAVLPLSAL